MIQFDTAVTHYDISANPTGMQFESGGGKGGTFTLNGTYGLRLNILNLNLTVAPGNQYPHGTDLKQSAPTLLEVRQIGDFEGTVNIAIGLSGSVCPSVSILTEPPRLVLHFAAG
ncbi:MAG: AMIN-like domain-containing (lipo)protein [Candidatus Dormibacteria bacterium]